MWQSVGIAGNSSIPSSKAAGTCGTSCDFSNPGVSVSERMLAVCALFDLSRTMFPLKVKFRFDFHLPTLPFLFFSFRISCPSHFSHLLPRPATNQPDSSERDPFAFAQASGALAPVRFLARLHRRRFAEVIKRHPGPWPGSLDAVMQIRARAPQIVAGIWELWGSAGSGLRVFQCRSLSKTLATKCNKRMSNLGIDLSGFTH